MMEETLVLRANAPYSDRASITWRHSPFVEKLGTEQMRAALLVGELDGDFDRVDELMSFESGTTARWFDADEAFAECTMAAYSETHPKVVDYSKGLSPKQLIAAQLLFSEGLRQIEVAKKVGVTTRTVRNWANDAVFQRYGEALSRDREARSQEERRASDLRIQEQLQALREDALKALAAAIKGRDTRVAMEIVRPLLTNR